MKEKLPDLTKETNIALVKRDKVAEYEIKEYKRLRKAIKQEQLRRFDACLDRSSVPAIFVD